MRLKRPPSHKPVGGAPQGSGRSTQRDSVHFFWEAPASSSSASRRPSSGHKHRSSEPTLLTSSPAGKRPGAWVSATAKRSKSGSTGTSAGGGLAAESGIEDAAAQPASLSAAPAPAADWFPGMPAELAWVSEDVPDFGSGLSTITLGSSTRRQVLKQMSEGATESAHIENMLASGRITVRQAQKLRIAQRLQKESRWESLEDAEKTVGALVVRSEFKSTSGLLREALVELPGKSLFYYISQQLGILPVQRAIARERRRRAAPGFQQPFPLLARLLLSPIFELVMGAVTCFNAVLIGVQVSSDSPEEAFYMEVLEQVLTAVFAVEVALRLLVCGWVWLCSPGNVLDAAVIFVTGVIPMWILKPFGVTMANMRFLQVLRTLRLLRLIQSVREWRFFRTPFKLFKGLSDSLHIILHVYLVIGTAIFIFAVYGVYFIGRAGAFQPGSSFEQTEEAWPEACSLASTAFATMPRSTFTVVQVMTLDDWSHIARPLLKYTIGVPCIFVAVIMVNALILENLITAVIVNNTMQCAKQDEEVLAAERREAAEKDFEDFRAIFWSLKADRSDNVLSEEEFLSGAQANRRLRNKLQCLQIAPDEMPEVWELLAEGCEREIGADRFTSVMRQLGSGAKAKDTFACARQVRRVVRRLERLNQRLADHKKMVEALQLEADSASKEFGTMLHEAHEFVKRVGVCIPSNPVSRDVSELTTCFAALPWRRREGEEAQERPGR